MDWRPLLRLLVRGLPARLFVLPALLRNERSALALDAYVARRARALGVKVAPDPTRLQAVPPDAALLAKPALRADPARHLRPRRVGSLVRNTIRTSGTSGSPLTLVQSLGAVIREEAFIQRQLHWIGWRPGQRRAWIRGDIVGDGHYFHRDPIGKMLVMSSYHLSNATIGAYVAALETYDPVVIQAYPSSIGAIANWLQAVGRRYAGRALRGVMTSSETLAPDVRAAVVRGFGVPVFDWYGQAERVAAIGTCEQGRYHLLTDYGGVELLPLPDGSCELVGTSLNNAAMPLARYRTGDTVLVGSAAPCGCGRVFPTVEAVIGRQERSVTLPDGRMVARLDRVFQGHDACLLEGQVRYHGDGRFTLRVVATAAFGAREEAALCRQFLLRVPGVQVAVERVEAIARGANGKFEFIAVDE
ncbi:phenylacetate--CoA ligase family protein [Massilia sp. HP4]|uniref:phenylacetate--CoA ligase family protein n=1 Tax=Massilia sp. HP4 TaxID=2562316 RepID=UPI0010BFE517|nr:phenylacetate--CoA ligase family protein [Massilia sp. HP4]